MPLDSGAFLLFLGLLLVAALLSPRSWRPAGLLIASLVFYGASSLKFLVLVVLLTAMNYLAVRCLTRWADGPGRTSLFAATVVLNASILIFFKWATLRHAPLWGLSGLRDLTFPLGLSFFTFQMIGCVTDVYRRAFGWTGSATTFFLFSMFFPQISSGPIPRAQSLVPQLAAGKRITSADISAGVNLIAFGLVSKLVVANRLHSYVRQAFHTALPIGAATVLLGFALNALEIYADFSGYTDLARGAARLFGIDLGINFNHPFLAESITEFWRRWHISLSSWLRDYLYMPIYIRIRALGKTAAVVSFMVTFLICGLWHRFDPTMALFGLLHGLALSIETLTKSVRKRFWKYLPEWVAVSAGRVYVFTFVALTQVLFSATDLRHVKRLFAAAINPMFTVASFFAYDGQLSFVLVLTSLALWAVMMRYRRVPERRTTPEFLLACAVIILLIGQTSEGNFIYVRF